MAPAAASGLCAVGQPLLAGLLGDRRMSGMRLLVLGGMHHVGRAARRPVQRRQFEASGMAAVAGGVQALEHTVSGMAATAQEYRRVEDGHRGYFGGVR